RVLREPRTPDSAAVALREMGTAVVPAMISLLEDRRPTRSVGQPRNGGVVLRNCDVALEILADIAGQNLPNNTTTFDPRSERGAFLSSADEKTAAEIIQRVKQWWQTTENNSSVQPDDEKDGRQPQSEYKKTLESGVTVELIGMCEYPSAGKQWWRPNGSVLENPPYDNSSIYTTGTRPFDSIPTELAFRLSSRLKEPAYEALIKMDDKILVHTTNNRLTGTTGQISEDGQVPSDIIAVGLYVPQNRKTTDFSLSLVIDGKRYEWFEFKNIAIRPNMGNDTVLNAEEKIFGSLEQSDARLLRSFLNQVDSEIHKLKDDYPQLADWDKEQTKTALLRTGKEITDTRLTYYHAAFAGNSPSGQDWCENNGCYIRVKLSTGLESPYMKTMSLPLKEGRLLALATVITDKPENRELEQKINEIITTTAASIRQKTEAQAESAKPKEPNKGQSAVQIEMRLLHTSENFPEEVGRKLNLKLDFNTPLDDLQIDSLIKAAQADEGTKMLAAPKVTVLDNQDAQFFIGHEVPSISGYTIAEEPKPVIEYKRIGIICELTPHVSPDGQNVFTELELEFSQLTGFKERVFQGILQEQVPQFETNNVATSKTIPGGKTLLIDGGPITIYEKKKSTSAETTTDSSERTKEKKRLIILIKPVILSPEQVEALGLNETPPPAMMGEYSYGYGQGDPPLGLGGMGGNSYGTPPPEISKRESTNLENRGTVENISPTGKSSILANEISDTSVISEDDNDIIRRIKEAIEPELSHQAGGITGSNLGGLVDTNNTNQSNIDIGTSEKARFFTRADNEKITGEFGFDTLQRKEGGLWELSKPYKNIYQPDFTCYITADKASITLETAAETTITKDVTFSGNVLIHFIPASSGDLKETKIYCDKLAFYSDSSQTMIDGPTTVVLGDSLTGDIIPGTPPLEIQKLQKAGKPMTIVYDISDLAGTTDDVNNLIRRIKETIEPDSWWEKGGIGTITAFPAPQPRKLSVYQSAQIHQEIQKFLDTMRPTSGEEFIPSAQPTFPQNWDQIMKWIESAKNGPNEKTSGREKIRQQIDELSERFKELETRRKNLQAQAEMFEKYRELPGNRQEYINNLPSVKSLAEKLAEVEKELIEARQMYTESHPQVRQLIQLQQELNKRLDEKRQEAGRAYDQSINPEARQQELDDLRAELEATKPLVQQLRDTLEKENKEAKAPENKPEKPQLSNKILIEAKILKVTDDFLEYAGLDANSLAESDIWSKYLVPDSNGSPHFIIDKLNTDLLIKAAESHKYCNIIKWPILTAKNGKPAEMAMVDQEYFFLGTSNEPNDSDGKKISELQEIATGTTIRLTPELTEENKTVRLDCEVKINWLKEFKKQKIGNTEMPIPQISTFEDTSLTLIPDGYTLLIRGEKITKTTEKQESRPILNLPIVNRIFRTKSEIKITDEYTPLILIQPSIVTQQ
ncbi:MAG: hypothetical protein JW715_07220, partial [Sedimentisphaerales bacterium]|nr:hypothetical protein [Sedimentisphaerales bacterium]